MGDCDPARPGGWSFRDEAVARPLDFSTGVPVTTGGPPLELRMTFTDDGLYVPAVLQTPPGDGPFPTVVALHGGSGGLGVPWLVEFARERRYALDRLLDAGYAVCVTEGRMEVEDAYGMDPVESTTPPVPAVLDHQDVVATYESLQGDPSVDADRVGFVGVSHGGELGMKILSEIEDPPAALVALEPGVIEYLGLRYDGERTYENLQFRDSLDDSVIDVDAATERIERVDDDVPILVGGRDDDHLQGLFRKLHELLDRAGKDVTWRSWDHPEHAYQWGPRRTSDGGPDDVDEVTAATVDAVVEFLNEHVRDR